MDDELSQYTKCVYSPVEKAQLKQQYAWLDDNPAYEEKYGIGFLFSVIDDAPVNNPGIGSFLKNTAEDVLWRAHCNSSFFAMLESCTEATAYHVDYHVPTREYDDQFYWIAVANPKHFLLELMGVVLVHADENEMDTEGVI